MRPIQPVNIGALVNRGSRWSVNMGGTGEGRYQCTSRHAGQWFLLSQGLSYLALSYLGLSYLALSSPAGMRAYPLPRVFAGFAWPP